MRTMTIAPEIEADRELLPLVLGANQILDRQMGPSAGDVSASWKKGEWGTPTVLLLELEDRQGPSKATARFALDELKDPRRMTARLFNLWGDLLQVRSHRLLERLGQSDAPMDGQEAWEEIVDAMGEFEEQKGVEPTVVKLPIKYAVALLKLGPPYWGDSFQEIRKSGTRALENMPLLGMKVHLVPGVDAKLELVADAGARDRI